MELPSWTDIELQLALLRAIHQYPDGTAVSEELRPIVENDLNLIVGDDQRDNWTATISYSLIDMRDKKSWLMSPYYKPESNDNKSMNRIWLEANRPGVNTEQRIWIITEKGRSVIHEGLSSDQQIPSKKSTKAGLHLKNVDSIAKKGEGKLKYDEAANLMYIYYKSHVNELPGSIHLKREFIIDLLVKGTSVEDAFSTASNNVA